MSFVVLIEKYPIEKVHDELVVLIEKYRIEKVHDGSCSSNMEDRATTSIRYAQRLNTRQDFSSIFGHYILPLSLYPRGSN